jgi:hypothetical protein
MTDPGVLGTLLIGLDHLRAESDGTDRSPTPRAPRTARPKRDRRLAGRVATSLRWLADALEPARQPRELGTEG